MQTHHKFTSDERDLLSRYLAQGINKTERGRRLGRPRQTVIEEIKRNGSWLINQQGQRVFIYIAISAQAKSERRQLNCAYNKEELKNPTVYQYVTEHLRGGWSPEQIEGRLREIDHPGKSNWQISHETIYQWIYSQPRNAGGKHWYEYLRRKQKKRRKQKGRRVHRCHIPDRISISQRPEAANNRTEFGHWEGDSIEGKRKNQAGLHTEVERMSRRIKTEKVDSLTSEQAYLAQCKIFGPEPKPAVKSTTLDNGRETHLHYRLRTRFKMNTYHAHPYSSFERGTNEHGNWHLRYYFPKGTDFSLLSNVELQEVVEEINCRPRKILGFKTANEMYDQLLKETRKCHDSK